MKKSKELIKLDATLKKEILSTISEYTKNNGDIKFINSVNCRISEKEKTGVLVNVCGIKQINDKPFFVSEYSVPYEVNLFNTSDVLNVIVETEKTIAYNSIK